MSTRPSTRAYEKLHPDATWHGTITGYKRHGCSCPECKAAVNRYNTQHRAEKRAVRPHRLSGRCHCAECHAEQLAAARRVGPTKTGPKPKTVRKPKLEPIQGPPRPPRKRGPKPNPKPRPTTKAGRAGAAEIPKPIDPKVALREWEDRRFEAERKAAYAKINEAFASNR